MSRRFAAAPALLVAGLALAVLVSRGTASAGSDATTTTTETTTTAPSSSTTTTETTTARSSSTTTTVATTSRSTQTVTTIPAATTTARIPKPPRARPKVSRLSVLVLHTATLRTTCVETAAVELSLPGRRAIVLTERSAADPSQAKRLVYPANASLVSIRSLEVAQDCARAKRDGRVTVRSLSLFRGTITAATVSIDVRGASRSPRIRAEGLRVGGRTVALAKRRVALGRWGVLTVGRSARAAFAGALVVRLLEPHAGLPAKTTVRVAFVAVRRQSRASLRHRTRGLAAGRPLEVTPPLGLHRYMFPVAGKASFWDSYGAFRPDVAGNWHHGDDIFAAVGTPVVAVANGTLNRVGWEAIGGWRLWVRDRRGNEFYYAHLSGYSPQALQANRVRAGEVLGFVGNTGDAFTTPFHLHFEVHPHQLLYLKYDGAVDPTTYLDHWLHVRVARVPKPTLPATLPSGDLRREAGFVFGELLAARGLTRHAPGTPPRIRIPGHDLIVRPFTAALASGGSARGHRAGSGTLLLPFLLAAIGAALALGGGTTVLLNRRRRSHDEVAQPAESEPA